LPRKYHKRAIEASKIAGHSDLEMTGEYTFVTAEWQNELTRRIQKELSAAGKKGAITNLPRLLVEFDLPAASAVIQNRPIVVT